MSPIPRADKVKVFVGLPISMQAAQEVLDALSLEKKIKSRGQMYRRVYREGHMLATYLTIVKGAGDG
jgi:hypothetical protein